MLKSILMVISIVIALAPSARAAELVGYWPFEESVGTSVNDQSGFSNHGNLGTAQRTGGQVGQGLFFDGTGGVTIPHSLSLDSLPGGFTLSAWIKPTEFPDYTTLFWKTDRHTLTEMLHFQVGDSSASSVGRLYGAMNQSAVVGGFEGISSPSIDIDVWHYVAWTYDESAHRFYDNGVEVFSSTFTDPWDGNTLDLLLGYHPELPQANFRGYIDEARIYRGALTPGELIQDQARGLAVPEPSTLLMTTFCLIGAFFSVPFPNFSVPFPKVPSMKSPFKSSMTD